MENGKIEKMSEPKKSFEFKLKQARIERIVNGQDYNKHKTGVTAVRWSPLNLNK